MEKQSSKRAYVSYIYIIAAAALWGMMSIFVKKLSSFGLSSMQIVFARAAVSSLILAAYALSADRSLFLVRPKHLPIFIGTGVISFTAFSYCYFTAMHLCSVSVAAVLLYTAPVFVMIMSAILFKEKITFVKVCAVITTVAGCTLMTGVFGGTEQMSAVGILFGLGAGLGYAAYSIFGRYGIERYQSLTVTIYTFICASAASLPFAIADGFGNITVNAESVCWLIAVGIFTSALPYLLYTAGLVRVESGRASVIASIEPIVAALIGTFILGEEMNVVKIIGIVLVFAAVVCVNIKSGEK